MNLHHALLLMLAVSVSPAYSTLQGGYAEDAISAAATTVEKKSITPPWTAHQQLEPGFYHGVASGSPDSNSMIFWTRYTPHNPSSKEDVFDIEYRIAKVPEDVVDTASERYYSRLLKSKKVRYGTASATKEHDWTIKLDITGLDHSTTYVYSFNDGTTTTEIGKTKTLPEDNTHLDSLKFAVFSCADLNTGYLHAYDVGSTVNHLDFAVHVGDTIYEYGEESCEAQGFSCCVKEEDQCK